MLASGFRNRSAQSLALPLIAILATLSCGCKVFETPKFDPAALSLAIAPEPVTAEVSDDPGYAWVATFTATLTETAGVGANISSVNATLSEVVDGVVVVGGEATLVKIDVSTSASRVEPNGSVTIDCVVHYTLPGGGRGAVVDIVVRVKDDITYTQNVSGRATVE